MHDDLRVSSRRRMGFLVLGILFVTLYPALTSGAGGSQYLLHCTNLTARQLESITLARGVCALGCLLTAMFVLLLQLLSKSYKTTLQRLFMYLTIMTVLLEVCLSMQIEHYFKYTNQETFCTILGFFSEYIGSVTYMFTNEISIYLVFVVYVRLKGRTQSLTDSVCLTKSLEWVMVGVAVMLPLVYTWVPFLDGKYGLNGATCWIKTLDENCTQSGLRDQLVIMGARYTVYAVIVMATIALVIVYCRMAYRYREVGTPQIWKLLRQTLLLCVAIVIAVTVLTLLSMTYVIVSFTTNHDTYGLWLANAAGIPFSMLLVPVIFLIYVRNVNAQTNLTSCAGCNTRCISRGTHGAQTEQMMRSGFSGTNPPSTRQTNPSDTHFDIGYTGEFTIITSGAVEPRNEGDPLVKANDSRSYNTAVL